MLFLVVLYPQHLELRAWQPLWLHIHLLNELMNLCELDNSSPPPPRLGSVCSRPCLSLRSGTQAHHCPTFPISPCLTSSLHLVHLPGAVPGTSLISLLSSPHCSSHKHHSEHPLRGRVPPGTDSPTTQNLLWDLQGTDALQSLGFLINKNGMKITLCPEWQ